MASKCNFPTFNFLFVFPALPAFPSFSFPPTFSFAFTLSCPLD